METRTPLPGTPPVAWTWRRDAAAEARAEARDLRRRGLTQAAVGLAAAVALTLWRPPLAAVVAVLAVLTGTLAAASPRTGYAALSRLVARFAHGVGIAVTWLTMPLLYYLLFAPAGLFLRRHHHLRITLRPDPKLPSYWQEGSRAPSDLPSFRRQF